MILSTSAVEGDKSVHKTLKFFVEAPEFLCQVTPGHGT